LRPPAAACLSRRRSGPWGREAPHVSDRAYDPGGQDGTYAEDLVTDRQDGILLYNGLLLIFAAFFFLWFLGALHGVLRSVEGGSGGNSSVALAGGLVFITLMLDRCTG